MDEFRRYHHHTVTAKKRHPQEDIVHALRAVRREQVAAKATPATPDLSADLMAQAKGTSREQGGGRKRSSSSRSSSGSGSSDSSDEPDLAPGGRT